MIEKYIPFINYLNKNIYQTDLDTIFKYSPNTLIITNTYEFNSFKEDLRLLITETLENEGLYQYVLTNMMNNNYVCAVSLNLVKENNNLGTISITKRTYGQALEKILISNLSDTAKMRASLLLNYVSKEKCYQANSNLYTEIQFKDGNKAKLSNTVLLDILTSNDIDSKAITSKLDMDKNTIDLLLYVFLSTGVTKKFNLNNDALEKEETLKKIDISSIVFDINDQPKMMLNKNVVKELFKYMNDTYSNTEIIFHLYNRMKELDFSIQSLAYIATMLGIDNKLSGGVLKVQTGEFNLELTKERYRILGSTDTSRSKIYQLEEKVIDNIASKKVEETKLFNNIAYYKNFYLKDGVTDKDKLIAFLRIVSSKKYYDVSFAKLVKKIYKQIFIGNDYKLYMITNNVINKDYCKIIPITILKTSDTYYVVDPSSNIRVTNYSDINTYLSAKEYYSNLFEGKCDILC